MSRLLMRSANICSFLACILLLAFSFAEEEQTKGEAEVVITLTDDSFDDFISGNPYVLAEFYAPWCGHCKQLAPEFEKAAQLLADQDPPVKLAKIDATVESGLAKRFEVQGYPTLKFFRSGKAEEFDGPRNADGIVAEVKKLSDPNYKPPPEAVVTLETQEDLDSFVKSADLTLVEFYAPWCGHCKKLAPEYEKAAATLLQNDPPIKLAKIDATVATAVASKYGVSGYPTLFLFRARKDANGEVYAKSYPYDGPREQHGIVEYMIKQSGDPAKPLHSMKELKANMKDDDIIVVGMFTSMESKRYTLYQESINPVRDTYSLYYTTDEAIRDKYKIGPDQDAMVVILPELMVTKYDEPFFVQELLDDTQSGLILGFIDAHETPLIGTKSTQTKARYSKRPLCVLFVPVDWTHEYRDMTASWRDKLLPVANKFRKDFHFAMSDDEQNSADMKMFGFEDAGSDFSFGCYGATGEKYPMEELDEWDAEEVESFLKKIKNGKAKSYLRSQIPPKKQTNPVTVVGKTFKQIVMDPTKDVLIELYAPWCGHCKKFEPEYKRLAKELSSEKNLILAKMNAVDNDTPENYDVKGYPTIYFAPANQKDLPIQYEGNRDLDDLRKFLKDNAHVSFKASKDEL